MRSLLFVGISKNRSFELLILNPGLANLMSGISVQLLVFLVTGGNVGHGVVLFQSFGDVRLVTTQLTPPFF